MSTHHRRHERLRIYVVDGASEFDREYKVQFNICEIINIALYIYDHSDMIFHRNEIYLQEEPERTEPGEKRREDEEKKRREKRSTASNKKPEKQKNTRKKRIDPVVSLPATAFSCDWSERISLGLCPLRFHVGFREDTDRMIVTYIPVRAPASPTSTCHT